MRHWKKRSGTQDRANVDMTPMLDIVFIMLIFFIVTAVFLDERGLDFSNYPDSKNPPIGGPETIQIYVDAKNRVSVERVPVQLDRVPLRVERVLADKPDANILLLVERRADLDPMVYIKDQMNVMGRQTKVKIVR